MATNNLEYEAEEYECAMMVLDDLGVPRKIWNNDDEEAELSLVGRIKWLNRYGRGI